MNTRFYKCKDGIEVFAQTDERFATQICDGLVEVVPNSVDAAVEKHVPIIETDEGGVLVKVGSVPHPMDEAHYIMWIEAHTATEVQRKYLKPGDAPEALFALPAEGLTVYTYCNLHGLWVNS